MGKFLRHVYNDSCVIHITLIAMLLIGQFFYSAIMVGRVEMAERKLEKLTLLSFSELGEIKTRKES